MSPREKWFPQSSREYHGNYFLLVGYKTLVLNKAGRVFSKRRWGIADVTVHFSSPWNCTLIFLYQRKASSQEPRVCLVTGTLHRYFWSSQGKKFPATPWSIAKLSRHCFEKSVTHAVLGKRNLTFSRTLCRVTPYCHLSKMPAAEGIIEVGSFKLIFRLIGHMIICQDFFLGGAWRGRGGF